MGRYHYDNEPNWGVRILGWFIVGGLGLVALAFAYRGVLWVWQKVFGF